MCFSIQIKLILGLPFFITSLHSNEVSWSLPKASPNTISADVALSDNQRMVICADSTYNQMLASLGPHTEEIIALKKPTYVRIGGEELKKFATQLSETCTLVPQGIAKINSKPKGNDYFITHSLVECVALAIHTPTATYFSHMDARNILSEKLYRLLDRVPSSDRLGARVTLVSSNYSIVLTNIYAALKKRNFQDIQADIEPCILFRRPDSDEALKYIKASTYGTKVEDIKGMTLNNFIEQFDNGTVVAPRSLIMNAKTGILYILTEQKERFIESSILYNLQRVGAFSSGKHS